jgi:hypothetical protein
MAARIDDLQPARCTREDARVRSVIIAAVALLSSAPGPEASAPPPPAEPTAPPAGIVAPLVGPSFDDDASLPAHAEDVVDYTLRATLDPVAHSVHGEGTITWRNTSTAPVREMWLHLYLNAFKNEHSTFLCERVGGRGSATSEDWGWIDVHRFVVRAPDTVPVDEWPNAERTRPATNVQHCDDDDETDARIPLPREIAPGETVAIDVAFDEKLPIVVERTGYRGSFHMVGQWFPKIARLERDGRWAHFPFHHLAEFYADYGTYDVTLDVPEGFTIGATGPVIERTFANGRMIERHVQSDVHDFAWTAWDKWMAARERIDGVDVTLLYPRGFSRVAARDLAAIRYALPYESAHYGRYPYSVLTVVHPQDDVVEAGGMEYPTLITSEGPWLTPPGILIPEIVAVHELGHQWFYGLVGTNELAWPFMDEGLNQSAEIDVMGHWRGPGSAVDLLGLRIGDTELQAAGGALRATDEPVAQSADAFTTGENYGNLVYARTAALISTLRRVYGEEPVSRALGRYARRYRFQHPVPEDLLAVFDEVLGARVAATMRTALFEKGWVDYAVEGATAEEAKRAAGIYDTSSKREKVEPGKRDGDGWDNGVLVRRHGTMIFPVDVVMTMADGTTRAEHWDGEGVAKRFAWHDSVALRGVVVDPDERVLLDSNAQNNHTAVEGRGDGSWRTLERVTYLVQLLLQAVGP